MKYVFDSNTLSSIFKFYYFDSFPSFWAKFNPIVSVGDITSVREVRRELEQYELWEIIKLWVAQFPKFFADPTTEELEFITQIYSIKHFQRNIGKKNLLKGTPVADPFIIAKAHISDSIVVSQEKFKQNASAIPNICKHFHVKCIDLEDFLKKENWTF